MPIIGKIIEGSHQLISIRNKCVQAGRQIISYLPMMMVVRNNIIVVFHMVGRNKNIIPNFLRLVNANIVSLVVNHIVLTGTTARIKSKELQTGLSCFQKHEQLVFKLIFTCLSTENKSVIWQTSKLCSQGCQLRLSVTKNS